NETGNLRLGILQTVERIDGFVGQHIILDAHNHKNKDIVFSFGFYPHVQLLDAQVKTSGNAIDDWYFEVQSGAGCLFKTTESFNDSYRLLFDRKKTSQQNHTQNYYNYPFHQRPSSLCLLVIKV